LAFSIIAAPVSRRTASFGGCTIWEYRGTLWKD
jgi:hypothetical protein